MNKNRKHWFKHIFQLKGYSVAFLANELKIKEDSFYRKLIGKNGFSERDIHILLKILDMKFEEVFLNDGKEPHCKRSNDGNDNYCIK